MLLRKNFACLSPSCARHRFCLSRTSRIPTVICVGRNSAIRSPIANNCVEPLSFFCSFRFDLEFVNLCIFAWYYIISLLNSSNLLIPYCRRRLVLLFFGDLLSGVGCRVQYCIHWHIQEPIAQAPHCLLKKARWDW
jgi:hypothetical protein